MDVPFLIGSLVYLRPLEPADARTLVRWMNDRDVTRTLGMYRPMTEESEREFIERVTKSPNEIGLAIVSRRGDRFIGTVGLMMIDWRSRLAEFGISIGDKASWGRGYGTEATRLVTAYAFETVNLNRVWLRVFENNPGAIRAYERAGFRREGTLRRAVFVDGAYRDVHVMAVLRDEWAGAKRGAPRPAARRAGKRPAPRRVTRRTANGTRVVRAATGGARTGARAR